MKTLLPNLNATPVSPSVLSARTSFQADPLPSNNTQSFSSTLAREVADRSTSDQQVKSSQNQQTQQNQPVQNNAAQNSAEAQSADSSQTQNAQDAQSAQQAADGKQVDAKKDDKAKADKDAAAASDADKTSTDLLALVAASQQVDAKAAPQPDAAVQGQPVAAMLTADIVNNGKNTRKTDDAIDPDARATKTGDLTQALPDTLDAKAGKSGKADPTASFKDIADAKNAAAGNTSAKGDAAAQTNAGAATPTLNANALAKATPDTQALTGASAVNNNAMFNPALQAVNSAAPAAAAAAADKLTPTVGTTDWDNALGQKMVWMSGNGQQSATLTLNPKDLGPLQVVINVNKTQADATFIASTPEVKAALEAAMPKLREMMDQAGIQLGQANVSTGMPNQQQQAFNQPQRSSNNGGGNGNGRNNASSNDDGVIATGAIAPASAGKSGLGLVDTFV